MQINCFNKFSLYFNGAYVNIKNKKAEELIAYLTCEKGYPVKKKKISEFLWPNVDAKKAMDSLYKVCKSIKDLNSRGIVIPIESYHEELYLDIYKIDCDIIQFEKLYDYKNNIEWWEKAISLYKGSLFYNDTYEWSALLEAYYEIRYYEMLEKLMNFYFEKGDLVKAYYYQKLKNNI